MINKQGSNASKSNSKAKYSMSVSANSSKSSNSSKSQPASKSQNGVNKRKQPEEEDDQEDEEDQESVDSMDQDEEEEEEPDTDQEIENSKKVGASKKTAKRKRRATSPTSFGATLQGLLGIGSPDQVSTLPEDGEEEDEDQEEEEEDSKKIKKQKKSQSQSQPSTAILSMAPHLRRSAASTTLNARAARLALDQRKKREERAHVTDVIGGWGPPGSLPDEESEQIRLNHLDNEKREFLENDRKEWEKEGGTKGYEKKLRKVAQRGVVKLFNAIRAAQSTTTDDVQAATTEIPKSSSLPGGKKQNALGGKESALADLSKSNFLDLIRSGGAGSKAGAKKVAV